MATIAASELTPWTPFGGDAGGGTASQTAPGDQQARSVVRVADKTASMTLVVAVLALLVTVLALLFAVGSFWWLNARRGHLEVARPRTYAFSKLVRLRLPLAFFNTGAAALVVADLQLVINEEPPLALRWITTRTVLRPRTTTASLTRLRSRFKAGRLGMSSPSSAQIVNGRLGPERATESFYKRRCIRREIGTTCSGSTGGLRRLKRR